VNDPPRILNPPDLRISYKEPFIFDYSPYVIDVDTPFEKLILTAWNGDMAIAADGFKITYDFDKTYLNRSLEFKLSFSDTVSIAEDTIQVYVAENLPPRRNSMVADLADIELWEGGTAKDFNIGNYFVDPEGGDLTITNSESNVEISIGVDGKVVMYAKSEWSGTEKVVFRAEDELGAFCEDWIYVTVNSVDDPPFIEDLPLLVVHYDDDYLFNLKPYVTDVDTLVQYLSLSTNNEYVTIPEEDDLVLRINFPKSFNGETIEVLVNITDGTSMDSAKLEIKVMDNSIPWLVQPIPDLSFKEDTALVRVINLNMYFIDPDKDPLTFSSESENIHIDISDVTGEVSLNASKDWFGEEYVTFRARDKYWAFVETQVKVTVEPVPDPPTLDEIGQIFMDNSTLTINLLDYGLYDMDNDLGSLEITVTSDDPNLLVFVNGYDVFLIVDKNVDGSFTTTITINVSDGDEGISQEVPVDVEIKDPNVNGETNTSIIIMFIIIAGILIAVMFGAYLYFYRGYYTIDEIYLVYKDGRLIFHKLRPGLVQKDEDIVTSMLTAIQEFVEETFSQGKTTEQDMAIKKMQLGGKTIIIEKGENIYIAIILKGVPGARLQRQMTWVIHQIEEDYAKELKKWNGVVSKLSGTYKYLNVFLKKKSGFRERLNFIELTR